MNLKLKNDAIKLQGQSHFSALQPVLSSAYTKSQIHSLLSLSLLFWQKPTFTDTHLGDNPHLFAEFLNTDTELVTPLIVEMFSAGEARLLLRDKFVLPNGDETHECTSLIDVFEGWHAQNKPGAWVVPPSALNRRKYMEVWNERIPTPLSLSYDYIDVKNRFQSLTRTKLFELRDLKKLGIVEKSLLEISDRNWFSHSDIFEALQQQNIATSELARVFGLLDEVAYAESLASGLSAIDVPNSAVFESNNSPPEIVEHVSKVMADAFGQVPLTDLRLLSALKFEEILAIREKGAFLRDEIRSLVDKDDLRDSDIQQVALSLAAYWKIICSEIDRLHPGATRQKTKFGLYVSSKTNLPIDDAIEGLSIVISGLASIVTGDPEGQSGLVRKIVDTLSFKFLLSGERDEMKKLKSTLSKNSVLSSSARIT